MTLALPAIPDEIRSGWRIIVGCSIGIATGVALMFLSFSIFILPLTEELRVSRGDLSSIQALIVTAALGSPLIGWLTDLYGIKRVYVVSAFLVAAINTCSALFASSLLHMGLTIGSVGLVSAGTGTVVLSRPISAHFRQYRGTALGLMAMGISLLAIAAPPVIQMVVDQWGWRGAFLGMSTMTMLIGIPAVLWLVPETGRAGSGMGSTVRQSGQSDWRFLRSRDFWLMVFALITMSLATAGAGGQLVPMARDAGLDASTAALALSFFAGGTFVGRLGGGWLLDRFEPRQVASLLTVLPAFGFVLLLMTTGMVPAVLLAVTIIGIQQGAEIDIFAFMVARRFDLARYSAIYGTLVGLGWIGNVGGLIGMAKVHDIYGSYAPAQLAAVAALTLSALLLLLIRLPRPREEAPA